MPTAAFCTLGCKVNQYETEKIRAEMESLGFRTVSYPGPADVLVVNSCTVTGAADAKSRAAVRRACRRNPNAVVVATGCSAELDPLTFEQIDGVDMVIPNADKTEIAERIAGRFPELPDNGRIKPRPRIRTRAIVKVQDGCNQFCAYCAVPLARPHMVSRNLGEIISEVQLLAGFGYKEIVLTGIRLGSYEAETATLPDLVFAVAEVGGIERVRLSSIEVWEISSELIEAIKHPKVCRHLHVPLQSGSDDILKEMRRPYNGGEYRSAIKTVRGTIDELALTTDVMVGFPGETEEHFRQSYEFVKEMQFSRLHVFRYSPRPGTKAAEMPDSTPPATRDRRSRELIELGERLSGEFAERMVGTNVQVLVEKQRSRSSLLSGLTDNYVEVEFTGPEKRRGQIAEVYVTGRRGNLLIGGGE